MRIFPRMVGGEALSPSPFTLIPILSSSLSYLLFMSKPGIFSRIKTEKFPTIIQFLRSQNTQKEAQKRNTPLPSTMHAHLIVHSSLNLKHSSSGCQHAKQ